MSFSELESLLFTGTWDQQLQTILASKQHAGVEGEAHRQYVTESLRGILNAQKNIEGIILTDSNGAAYPYSPELGAATLRTLNSTTLARMKHDDNYLQGKIKWFGSAEDEPYIVGAQRLIQPAQLQPYGSVVLIINTQALQKQFEPLKTTQNSFFIIWDQFGKPVADNCTLCVT